jgi:N-acetylglutamate synthase-like GNAT family acetyltransferase
MSPPDIRRAKVKDAQAFHRVEEDAAALLRTEPSLAGITIPPSRSRAQYEEIIRQGHSLVAVTDRVVVGIAAARPFGRELHLHELSVASAAQRRGVGTALLIALIDRARAAGFDAVTLNTFRDIPWNAPFYARHGFQEVENVGLHARLSAALEAAVAAGLPRERRCAMSLSLR